MGLNFAPVPTKFPLHDTITGIEEAARRLPQDDANDLHTSSKLPKDNIIKEHRGALQEMKGWKDEVILPADKGNATVVMKRSDYDEKMEQLLQDPTTYQQLPKDPTPAQESKLSRKLKSLEKCGGISSKLYQKLRPTGSQPPRIYGLPKIHKPAVPIRPIVSCIGSPSYELSKHIVSIISPLAGKTESHVLNSRHFAETMREIRLERNEIPVSFDVSSLFTNVPIVEAVDVILLRLRENEGLDERTPLSPGWFPSFLGC